MEKAATAKLLETYRPSFIPLETDLIAAIFPLMKIYPADFCVRQAAREGLLKPGSLVIESSSGTLALGLAIVCNWFDYRLTIVTDCACDDTLRRRIEDLGARVERVSQPAAEGGYQRARLDRLHEICESTPDHWWLNQYDNPANPASYASFAAQIAESLGRIDCLVGTVGSGGSMCGTGRHLRSLFPDLQLVGVDTFHSVLFGHNDGARNLRGLGNSLWPANLDQSLFDEVHWVTAAEAYAATRMLHRTTALYRGGTSGAAWLAAHNWVARHPGKRALCIFPDDGTRYANDIYNDKFLRESHLRLAKLPAAPRLVDSPAEAGPSWSMMHWARRSYAEVTKQPAIVAAPQ